MAIDLQLLANLLYCACAELKLLKGVIIDAGGRPVGFRPHKGIVGCFNLTASLDHLDYDCVVVAISVHVLG